MSDAPKKLTRPLPRPVKVLVSRRDISSPFTGPPPDVGNTGTEIAVNLTLTRAEVAAVSAGLQMLATVKAYNHLPPAEIPELMTGVVTGGQTFPPLSAEGINRLLHRLRNNGWSTKAVLNNPIACIFCRALQNPTVVNYKLHAQPAVVPDRAAVPVPEVTYTCRNCQGKWVVRYTPHSGLDLKAPKDFVDPDLDPEINEEEFD